MLRTLVAALFIATPAVTTVPITSTRYGPSTVVQSATVVHGRHGFLAAWGTKSDIRVVPIGDGPRPPESASSFFPPIRRA